MEIELEPAVPDELHIALGTLIERELDKVTAPDPWWLAGIRDGLGDDEADP